MSQSKLINPLPQEWIEKIFMRLHGRFGNGFLSKFKTNQLNENGEDIGIENAKQVWAEELAGMSGERIKAALEASYEHAPSCDAFKANCRVKAEIQDYVALPRKSDPEATRANAEKAKQVIADVMKNKTNYRAWIDQVKNGDPKTFPNYELSLRYALEAEKA
jgi:hypothetical protein